MQKRGATRARAPTRGGSCPENDGLLGISGECNRGTLYSGEKATRRQSSCRCHATCRRSRSQCRARGCERDHVGQLCVLRVRVLGSSIAVLPVRGYSPDCHGARRGESSNDRGSLETRSRCCLRITAVLQCDVSDENIRGIVRMLSLFATCR